MAHFFYGRPVTGPKPLDLPGTENGTDILIPVERCRTDTIKTSTARRHESRLAHTLIAVCPYSLEMIIFRCFSQKGSSVSGIGRL